MPSDRTKFLNALGRTSTFLGRRAEVLTWWSAQATRISGRIAADGPAAGFDFSPKDALRAQKVATKLFDLSCELGHWGEVDKRGRQGIDRIRKRFEHAEAGEFEPTRWNRLLADLDFEVPRSANHRDVYDKLVQLQNLQPVLLAFFTGGSTDVISSGRLATDRDFHGLLRMPAQLSAINAELDRAARVMWREAERLYRAYR